MSFFKKYTRIINLHDYGVGKMTWGRDFTFPFPKIYLYRKVVY